MTEVTFSGIQKNRIAEDLKALATWLIPYNIGNTVHPMIENWIAPGGLAEQIAAAQSKQEIKTLLTAAKSDYDHSPASVLGTIMRKLIPSFVHTNFPPADNGQGIDVNQCLNLIGNINDWRGFNLSSFRFHVMTAVDIDIGTLLYAETWCLSK